MLSLTNLALLSPPTTVQLVPYRPAVSVKNSGDVSASLTGTLSIFDLASGRAVYSRALYCSPIAAGATGTASTDQDWTPSPGASYRVEATLFAGNGLQSASAVLAPVTITTSATPSTGTLCVKISIAGQTTYITYEEKAPPVIQYPFYLTF
jgi:hypothetical protein